jgi:glycosyltransferase involved in cell wall biosynthesis
MKLAVVIPAYKKTFFELALASLAAQSNSDFTVYIGDDHSPEDLRSVVDRFRERLRIQYTRFSFNIGPKDLVKQWERCVGLIRDEAWVWVFSDDDIASENCVESFFRAQARTDGEVYRFNTRTVDAEGREIRATRHSPDFETSEQMALNLLLGLRGNSMPDHIFSRKVYERNGGFVYTPYAQGADWAMSMLFSREKGMHVVQDARVDWRWAGASVSSNAAKNRTATILGHYVFIAWVLKHFAYLKSTKAEAGITYQTIERAALKNLHRIIAFHYRGLPPTLYFRHLQFLRREFGLSFLEGSQHILSLGITRLRHDRYERLLRAQEERKKRTHLLRS